MEPGNPYSYWYLKPVSNLMFLMLIFFLFHKENSTKALFLEYYLRLFRKKKKKKKYKGLWGKQRHCRNTQLPELVIPPERQPGGERDQRGLESSALLFLC